MRYAARIRKGLDLALAGHVYEAQGGGYIVVSRDFANSYRVDLDALTCSCPDGQYRPAIHCKHLWAACLHARCVSQLLRAKPAGKASENRRVTHELGLGRPLPFRDPGR